MTGESDPVRGCRFLPLLELFSFDDSKRFTVPNFRVDVIFCGAGFRRGRRGPFVSEKDPNH